MVVSAEPSLEPYQGRSVLLTNSAYRPCIGGIENSLHYIGRSLVELGVRTLVIASDQTPSGVGRLAARDVIDGIEVRRYRNLGRWINVLGLTPPGHLAQAFRYFRRMAHDEHFDAIIARQQAVGLAARWAFPAVPIVYVVPSIATELNREALRTPFSGSVKEAAYKRINRYLLLPQQSIMQRACLQRADVIVVFSDNMRRQVLEAAPSTERRVWVHPPGIDMGRFSPGENKPALRQALGLPGTGLILLGVGSLIRAKGFDRAIDALAALDAEQELHLLLVGDGRERGHLETQARRLGLADRVHFHGSTDHPERFYACADGYLMPSRYEGFGQSILEAMSAALPVVAYAPTGDDRVRTASDELVEDGRNGILCNIDAEGLAGALQRFLELPPNMRCAMGETARRSVEERYTWRAFAEFLLERIDAFKRE